MYEGIVVSKDTDKKTRKPMYNIRYDDGDTEDIFPGKLRGLMYDEVTAQRYMAMRHRGVCVG